MKRLSVLVFLFLTSSVAFGVLLPKPDEVEIPANSNDVLPPLIGAKECYPCQKNFKTGANRFDLSLIEFHNSKIFSDMRDGEDAESVQ